MITITGEFGAEININSFPETEKNFLLKSNGGDLWEGLAVYDYLSGKDVEITAIGMVASAASLALLATEKRYGTPNSRYLIHNPFTIAVGDAKVFDEAAKDMQFEQDEIIRIYKSKLSIDETQISELMAADKVINAQKALEIGLIKEIRQINQTTNINDSDMETTEIKNELSAIGKVLNSIKDMFSAKIEAPKNIILQDVNGSEIEFPEIETAEQISVGDSANVNGESANGEYVMPTGEVYVFENGALTEIRQPEQSEDEAEPEMSAEQKELEALRAENSQLKESLSVMNAMKADFDAIKAKLEVFSTDEAKDNIPAVKNDSEKGFSFQIKKINNN